MIWIMLYDIVLVSCITYIFVTTRSAWAFLLLIGLLIPNSKEDKK